MKDQYLLEFDDIQHLSIESFLNAIQRTPGIKLEELTVKKLSYHNEEIIYPGMGVYIFRTGTKFKYVGKVSSMSFTERIPKHLDVRPYAWMNSLLKILALKELNETNIERRELEKASKYAFDNLNLVLINFKSNERDLINRLERMLRSYPGPLNRFKRLRETDKSISVLEYCR